MAGVLNYKRYLNTLQAITDWGNTFPTTQETYVFSVEGGVTSSWTATIQWQTLLVDQIVWDRNQQPTFNNSQVIGYFESSAGTSTQYSTGVISIPANMYTGPILPTSDQYVPVTIVNLSWTDGTETYEHQLGLIQNWEPGVIIGNPYDSDDFEPVDPLASTLTLSVDTPAIYGDPFSVTAESDLPIEIGDTAVCSFYATSSTGATFLLTTSTFNGLVASKSIIAGPPLTATNYVVYAEFGGKRQYGRTTSNTATLEVVPGIPLVAVNELFTPSQSYYYPGNTFNYRLTVDAATGFTATTTIANTVTINIVNQFPPNSSSTGFTGIFADGVATATFTVTNTMIDTGLIHTGTQYTLLSYTNNTATFTASIFVSNTSTIDSQWLSYRPGKYAAGSHERSVNVATTISKTLSINSFPISIAQAYTATLYGETLPLPVVTVSTPYFNNVSIYAVSVAAPTTHVLLNASNNSGTSTYTVNTTALTTGTWTIYASYPGDLGSNVFYVNAASTSNNLTHVVKAGNTLDAVLTWTRTPSYDVLTVRATTSTTLTNTVSFLNGVSVLGTSTWSRQGYTVTNQIADFQGGAVRIAKAANNWSSLFDANTGNTYVNSLGIYGKGWPSNAQTTTNYVVATTSIGQLNERNPNAWRTWKYYDGTNYNLSAVTGTDFTALLDPITTGTIWTKEVGPDLQSNVLFGRTVDGREGYLYTDTRIPLINIYKTDEIGDYRGYNVIAIDADSGIDRPPVENGPIRLTWNYNPVRTTGPNNPAYTGTNYIDLVEYIGFVQWQKPIENSAQAAGTEPRTTVRAWLFRFTPEVRQSPDLLFRRLNPLDEAYQQLLDPSLPQAIRIPDPNSPGFNPTGYRWTQFPVGSFYNANGSVPSAANWVGTEDVRTWNIYGKKTWPSLNPTDPAENAYAQFCQQWYWMNTSDPDSTLPRNNQPYQNPFTISVSSEYQSSSTFITTGDVQTAVLYLAAGTITTSTDIHATWPGTISLPAQYGKFEPFDVYVSDDYFAIPRVYAYDVTPLSYTTSTPVTPVVDQPGVYSVNTLTLNTSQVEYATNNVFSTNLVKLTTRLDDQQAIALWPEGFNAGTCTFINTVTGAVIGSTSTIVNGTATIYVTAENLTNLTTAPFVDVAARFSDLAGNTVTTPGTRLQAIRTAFTTTAMTFSRTLPGEFYLDSPVSDLINGDIPADTTLPFALPLIDQLELGRAYRLDYQAAPGPARINGTIEVLLPMLKRGNPNYNSTNTNYAYNVYNPTSSVVLDFWMDVYLPSSSVWGPAGYKRFILPVANTFGTTEWAYRHVVTANSLANGPQLLTFTIPTVSNGAGYPIGYTNYPWWSNANTKQYAFTFENSIWEYVRWGVNIAGIDRLYTDPNSQYNPTTPYNRKVATYPAGSRIGHNSTINLTTGTGQVYP